MEEDTAKAWKHISSIQLFQEHFETLKTSCEGIKAKSFEDLKRKWANRSMPEPLKRYGDLHLIPYSTVLKESKWEAAKNLKSFSKTT